MSIRQERNKKVVEKFEELLRSGKDYNVEYMCDEAGKVTYIEGQTAIKIINKHYHQVITQSMIDFVNQLGRSRDEEIKQFSDKFDVCRRESILLIRYIKRNGRKA